jgi:hypothetical protein
MWVLAVRAFLRADYEWRAREFGRQYAPFVALLICINARDFVGRGDIDTPQLLCFCMGVR